MPVAIDGAIDKQGWYFNFFRLPYVSVRIAADGQVGRERLLRACACPPFALERLQVFVCLGGARVLAGARPLSPVRPLGFQ